MPLVILLDSDGYKILDNELDAVTNREDYHDFRVQLYDLNSGRWTRKSSPVIFGTLSSHGAYVDGNLYNMCAEAERVHECIKVQSG